MEKMNTGFRYVLILALGAFLLIILSSCEVYSHAGSQSMRNGENGDNIVYNDLTPEEENVIINKGTERPFTGEYLHNEAEGVYTCKRCGAELYRSSDKFDSHCGWPSFDDEVPGAVDKVPDADGMRTEITCANCGAHLGHVFYGEGLTDKNTRHCVNSISMNFIPAEELSTSITDDENAMRESEDVNFEKAMFASGCFWGVEYHFNKADGVISTTVGFTGGSLGNPTYREVCSGTTGHAEAVEIIFDPEITSYEDLLKLYFETHDFTQVNGQGPDIGPQYRSEIFYYDDEQKNTAERLIEILTGMGYEVATRLSRLSEFYPAEEYHQDYYEKNGKSPYCHVYRRIFDD